jgi:hypothetical protein
MYIITQRTKDSRDDLIGLHTLPIVLHLTTLAQPEDLINTTCPVPFLLTASKCKQLWVSLRTWNTVHQMVAIIYLTVDENIKFIFIFCCLKNLNKICISMQSGWDAKSLNDWHYQCGCSGELSVLCCLSISWPCAFLRLEKPFRQLYGSNCPFFLEPLGKLLKIIYVSS